jgi:antirestriction protein ArdC
MLRARNADFTSRADIPYRERTRAAEAGDEPEAIPFLKRFTVFNADQCENVPSDIAPPAEPLAENLILPQAEALITATGANIRIGGNRAFYVLSADYVQVPHLSGNFGSSSYAREELVALSGQSAPVLH